MIGLTSSHLPPRGGRAIGAQPASEGFAVGRALYLDGRGTREPGPGSGHVSLRAAIERVRRDLGQLVRTLSRAEAELFEPEARILEEIASRLLARERAGALRDAIIAETSCGCSDLVIDLRVRLLRALEGSTDVDLSAAAARYGRELVVVTELVTPTLVASLPGEVVAVVGLLDPSSRPRRDVGRSSHAVILARARGLPVAYVTHDALASMPNGSWVVVEVGDASASVCVEPDSAFLASARERQKEVMQRLRDDAASASLAHLGVEVRVNVATPHDDIPGAADGVGLVRTEIMFAGRLTAPSESEQLAALLLLAAKTGGRPVVVRLFDAGGDKPLAWLGGVDDPSRGIRRLLAHPQVLSTQLRALARAREHADIRVLVPFVRTVDDLNAVRRLTSPSLQVGAMIESPDAVETIESIVSSSDFISIGTNDLTATTLGLERSAAAPQIHPRVLALVHRVIRAAHGRGRQATICGEMAGDERGSRVAVGLKADALSVAPARFATVRRVLGRATADSCGAEAIDSMGRCTRIASSRSAPAAK